MQFIPEMKKILLYFHPNDVFFQMQNTRLKKWIIKILPKKKSTIIWWRGKILDIPLGKENVVHLIFQ